MVRVLFLLILLQISLNFNTHSSENINFIAHAGGEIEGFIYSNSLIAIKQSIDLGYQFIEIDLHLSNDGFFYGFHDFNNLVLNNKDDNEYLSNFKKKFLSQNINKNDLVEINEKLKYPLILEEDIINLFKFYTELNLVTDKTQNFNELEDKFKFMKDRLYIEINSKKNYLRSLFYSIENKIFLTSAFNFIDRLFIRLFNIKNVVFHKDILNMEIVRKRIKTYKENFNINFFTYTVNADDNLNFYGQYADFIYTDDILLKFKNGAAEKN